MISLASTVALLLGITCICSLIFLPLAIVHLRVLLIRMCPKILAIFKTFPLNLESFIVDNHTNYVF